MSKWPVWMSSGLGAAPVLLSPAECWGIDELLKTQVLFWLWGTYLLLKLGRHNGPAASKRSLFTEI